MSQEIGFVNMREARLLAEQQGTTRREKVPPKIKPHEHRLRRLLEEMAHGRTVGMKDAEKAAGMAERKEDGDACQVPRNPALWNALFERGFVTFPADYHAQITEQGKAALRDVTN